MPEKQKSMPILLPTKGWQHYFVRALYSITNFMKASILSIVILVVILLLLSRMEQAYTMLLRMIEDEKISLVVCFLMVNLLAISLSHFPIYTYYAGNLNGSKDFISWKKNEPFKRIPILRWIRVYTYKLNDKGAYVQDIYANVLRNYLGLFIFVIWILFILATYEVNLKFYLESFSNFKTTVFGCLAIPFLIYVLVKRKLRTTHSTVTQRKKMYRNIGISYLVVSMLSVATFTMVVFSSQLFSFYGLILLLVTTFLMMLNFVLYRLVRPRMYHIFNQIKLPENRIVKSFLSFTKSFGYSQNYLLLFQFSFFACIVAIVYFNLASIYLWKLPNGLSIVLIYLYFYLYIISSVGKFYFVYFSMAQKQRQGDANFALDNRSFKILTASLTLFILLFVIGQFSENSLNELEKIEISNQGQGMDVDDFFNDLQEYGDTLYFVNAHGGGLKANSWTLKVMQELQKRTGGKFLKHTIAMSGASGGSLGLALYGDLTANCNGDLKKIESIIQKIENDNYASVDISMVMGLDLMRTIFPLNQFTSSNDRSYYAMLRYQNHIHKKTSTKLNRDTFRNYWEKIQQKGKVKLPILIMNTASTSGRRGIFCSLNSHHFGEIFPYAKDLAEFREPKGNRTSVSFYQAISTTNRFPIFSPVAKIAGSGHYIDAGAIDNSGILGCFDLFLYYKQKKKLENKKVVFVDINNGKSAYAEFLLAEFIKKHPKVLMNLEEDEKSSISANIETGFNLSKIPGYLREFMVKYTKYERNIHFKQVFLPHKIGIKDIEAILDAKINDGPFLTTLKNYLNDHNTIIKSETEFYKGFFEPWTYYDPVLSRRLSKSNIAYFNKMRTSSLNGIDKVFDLN